MLLPGLKLITVGCAFFLVGCGLSLTKKTSESPQLLKLQQDVLLQQTVVLAQQSQLDELQRTQMQTRIALKDLTSAIQQMAAQLEQPEKSVSPLHAEDTPSLIVDPSESVSSDVNERDDKVTLGRIEWVWLDLNQSYAKARIDTGASTSSIHAESIQPFERDGQNWVKFVTRVNDVAYPMEAKLVKQTRVKQASLDEFDDRLVVNLNVGIGELYSESLFTLADRSKMLYPVLIGRNFLRDVAVVDVSKKFIHKRVKDKNSLAKSSNLDP